MAFTNKYASASGTAASWAAATDHGGASTRGTYAQMIAGMAAAELVGVSDVDGDFALTTTTTAWSDAGGGDTDPVSLIGLNASGTELVPTRLYGGGGLLDMSNSPKLLWTTGHAEIDTDKHHFQGIDFEGAGTSTQVIRVDGAYNLFYRCLINNTADSENARAAYLTGNHNIFLDCDFRSAFNGTGGDSWEMVAAFAHYSEFINCRFIGSGASQVGGHGGAHATSQRLRFVGCVFANLYFGINYGIATDPTDVMVDHCTFYNIEDACIHNSAARTSGGGHYAVTNCAAYNVGRFYEQNTSTMPISMFSNAVDSSAAADTNADDWGERNRVSLTSDPFPGAANNDFRPAANGPLTNTGSGRNYIGALPAAHNLILTHRKKVR